MSQPAPLSSFRVRPRFEQVVTPAPESVHACLKRALAEHAPDLVVRAFPGFIALHIPDSQRRYWSPRLFLSLEAAPGGTRIEGIYGPEIEVWSIFLYGYLATGLLATFSGIYGVAQRVIGQTPTAWYFSAAMLLGALGLYLFAQLGQKLGADQTYRLHQAYAAAAGELERSAC